MLFFEVLQICKFKFKIETFIYKICIFVLQNIDPIYQKYRWIYQVWKVPLISIFFQSKKY